MILLILTFFFGSSFASAADVTVQGGSFQPVFKDKGDEQIVISQLRVNSTPVTNKQFLEFVRSNADWSKSKVKSLFADDSYLKNWSSDFSYAPQSADQPVVFVSWFAARAYCKSKRQRLPTINEWEYFSNAGNPAIEAELIEWMSSGPRPLKAVGHAKVNKFGLHDTVGLVWEWVEDFSSAIVSEDSRAGAGGDFYCGGAAVKSKDSKKYAAFMRYAFRSSLKARYTASSLGFRCVETVGKEIK